MPGPLKVIAEWNPVTATACRERFGNMGDVPVTSWPDRHTIPLSIFYSLLITAIFVPLSVRKFRATATRWPSVNPAGRQAHALARRRQRRLELLEQPVELRAGWIDRLLDEVAPHEVTRLAVVADRHRVLDQAGAIDIETRRATPRRLEGQHPLGTDARPRGADLAGFEQDDQHRPRRLARTVDVALRHERAVRRLAGRRGRRHGGRP